MRCRPTLRERVEARIAERRDDAFLTREFIDLAGERQVLRALRELTKEGKLIRLGYGTYARAEISPITQQPMLAGDGFGAVSRQVLDGLGTDERRARVQRRPQHPGADDAARASPARQPHQPQAPLQDDGARI